MSLKCNHCINKTQCAECDKQWLDKFIPAEEVKHYFQKGYVGVRGINGSVYEFNTTNSSLKPTQAIRIGSRLYCPYCGEEMFVIQEGVTFMEIGHCCICQGARDEIEYEAKKAEIEKRYRLALEEEISELKHRYEDKLAFCTEKLLEIKHEKEKNALKSSRCTPNYLGVADKAVITVDDFHF